MPKPHTGKSKAAARHAAIVLLVLGLSACNQPPTPEPSSPAAAFTMHDWPLPTPVGAAQPDLVRDADGNMLLSWVADDGNGHALSLSREVEGTWRQPVHVARGDDWFVNWADTPHIAVTDDGALWAHWLQKSAAATYAYDVALVRSDDDGASWSAPVLVNDDGTPTEHGFVSMWPAGPDSIGMAWLDGRETAGGHADQAQVATDADQTGGAMTLRAARFDAALQRSDETRIDARTCDCCQTDVALTARGPLLAYRDRTKDEIRDIAVTRMQDGQWLSPGIVHEDRWVMPACPVNGPAVAADGDDAVVAWYTAANDLPTIQLAFSDDAGGRFTAPTVVDRGAAVRGRVDVAIDQSMVWVAWMREDATGQSLQLARYNRYQSTDQQRFEVARLQGKGRGTGFPQLALADDGVRLVWTDVVDGKPRLLGARIKRVAATPR